MFKKFTRLDTLTLILFLGTALKSYLSEDYLWMAGYLIVAFAVIFWTFKE